MKDKDRLPRLKTKRIDLGQGAVVSLRQAEDVEDGRELRIIESRLGDGWIARNERGIFLGYIAPTKDRFASFEKTRDDGPNNTFTRKGGNTHPNIKSAARALRRYNPR